MTWHIMLYADIPFYSSDTKHSWPEEKTTLLHCYQTVSSYKLNLISSNCFSVMHKDILDIFSLRRTFLPYKPLFWILQEIGHCEQAGITICVVSYMPGSAASVKANPCTYATCCLPNMARTLRETYPQSQTLLGMHIIKPT